MVVVDFRECRDVALVCAVAEHRDRDREPPRLLRQTREPERDRAGHRLGSDLAHALGVPRGRLKALPVHGVDERADEERVAACYRDAGRGELRVRRDPELELHHRRDPGVAKRGRPDQKHRRVRDELGQELRLDALLGRP